MRLVWPEKRYILLAVGDAMSGEGWPVEFDITGVPTVDTLVAQHLLKTITAARLMGAECIISGVRPQIAQTIVHLGINLEDVITKAKLSDAFALALQRSGRKVVRDGAAPASPISGLFAKREE